MNILYTSLPLSSFSSYLSPFPCYSSCRIHLPLFPRLFSPPPPSLDPFRTIYTSAPYLTSFTLYSLFFFKLYYYTHFPSLIPSFSSYLSNHSKCSRVMERMTSAPPSTPLFSAQPEREDDQPSSIL